MSNNMQKWHFIWLTQAGEAVIINVDKIIAICDHEKIKGASTIYYDGAATNGGTFPVDQTPAEVMALIVKNERMNDA